MNLHPKIKVFANLIGEPVMHPKHGMYYVDGVYKDGVFVYREGEDGTESEEFGFDELIVLHDPTAEIKIMSEIEHISGLGWDEFLTKHKKRDRELVELRQLYMVFLWKGKKLSLREAGAVVGKDHATVDYSFRAVKNLIETDDGYVSKYRSIIDIINTTNPQWMN